VKTTVELNDALFEQAREVTRQRGITFRALLEESLRKHLRDTPQKAFRLRKHSFGGKGTLPALDWKSVREEIYKGRGE